MVVQDSSILLNDNFWNNKNVFLTGHTGFKGSWLMLLLLLKGANVWGYSLKQPNKNNLFNLLKIDALECNANFNNQYADINDYTTLSNSIDFSKPDIIFHLAAQSLVNEGYNNPLNTWNTNVLGSIKILESLKRIKHKCAVVMITTDKVYKNNEWIYSYRENDILGGQDPYSASKSAMEIAISSWRDSFCGKSKNQQTNLFIASARAGNVIGGGDWSNGRIIPDCIKALSSGNPIELRNPNSSRPWQHVIEPLFGYLKLAEKLHENENKNNNNFSDAFNFGPPIESQRSVGELVNSVLNYWPGEWIDCSNQEKRYESSLLNLSSEKSNKLLSWDSIWDFEKTIEKTINWYKKVNNGESVLKCCIDDLNEYQKKI